MEVSGTRIIKKKDAGITAVISINIPVFTIFRLSLSSMIRFLSDTLKGNIPSTAGVCKGGMTFFLSFKGHVAAVAAKVGDVAKSSKKALVKPFYEKNFTEFLLDLNKWSHPGRLEQTAQVFRFPGTVIAGNAWHLELSCRLFAFTHGVSRHLRQGAR